VDETRADDTRALVGALRARIAAVTGAQVGISVHDLATGARVEIDADTVFHAASTMKVSVLFALYQEFASGRIPRDGTMRLDNRFRSIVDQSPYTLSASDDSDSSVYTRVGTDVPLRDLATRMITHSSNLATNALITRLDPTRITARTRVWGATRMQVLRGVEDNLAFRAGRNNTATANDLVALFAALETGRVANPADTKEMLAILEAQAFNDEIPAGLPPGTRVAHKTGSITATLHDAGLVYRSGQRPYAIAILTRNIPDQRVAATLIADCSRMIWAWATRVPRSDTLFDDPYSQRVAR
jgi:beta-lactamase class A